MPRPASDEFASVAVSDFAPGRAERRPPTILGALGLICTLLVATAGCAAVLSLRCASAQTGSEVAERWVRRYNGPGNSDDYASAIAVDAVGNIYVTGQSWGSGSDWDYATIKYRADGTEQWVRRYNGPGNGQDYASAVAVDAAGNVYVTGSSMSSGNYYDYATVKYGPDGSEQWVRRYDGPGNSADWAHAIAVDRAGDVYVTGQSDGSGSNGDYATIKYGADGSEQWVRRYNGPGNGGDSAEAIAVDADGDVYVIGGSEGSGSSYDYATIKYGADGSEQWVRRYNGPGNGVDFAYAVAVDAVGNAYVSGLSYASGNDYDYATVKYGPDGSEQWVRRYGGNGHDIAYAIGVDAVGNVYVTGISGSSEDYATIKYGADGSEQWVRRYNGPGNGTDHAEGVAVDADGDVYVTGWSLGSGSSSDYATIKYGADGSEQWVRRYNGPGNGVDHAYAITADAAGNVYVTGQSYASDSYADYATAKYSQAAPAVGGIAEYPQLEPAASTRANHSSVPNAFALTGLAASGALLLAAGGWYTRRRWLH
jgi:uncharacterized delta-60 repeat protein